MQLTLPITVHLVSVLLAFVIGAVNLVQKKGTPLHKLFGRVWIPLIFVASFASFFSLANGTFGWIHLIPVVNIIYVVLSYMAVRRGNIKVHQGFIIAAYIGTLVAGIMAAWLSCFYSEHKYLQGAGFRLYES